MELLWRLYQGDPNWIPPIRLNQEELVGFRPHPFYENAKCRAFLVEKDGKAVGRIVAIINHGHNKRYNEKRGFFGFFDCIDDQDAANALFTEACRYLKSEGMDDVRGPCNPSLNYEIGNLVEGFDTPPTFMMTYNWPYYEKLIKGFGFENGQSSAHNLDDSVVRSMIFRGAPPEALSKHGGVIATHVQDERYINEGLHHARLVAVAGNAIENEPVVIRPEGGSRHMIVQTPLPEPHGQFVRHQLTARRVVHECASQR
jgi:hypothetical protein